MNDYNNTQIFNRAIFNKKKCNDCEQMLELLFDIFEQSCLDVDGRYEHKFISAYERVQHFLIEKGMIDDDDCCRP